MWRTHKALRPAIGLLLIAGCSTETAPTAASDRDPTLTSARPAPSGSSARESFESRAIPASLDWQQTARSLIAANNLSPLAAARVLAALGVAEYRAVVAADDAATVTKPNGGLTVLLPRSWQDFWKLQKERGNSGHTNKARIAVKLLTNR